MCIRDSNKTLQYLNIGGLPLHQASFIKSFKSKVNVQKYYPCQDTLQFIKINFPHLKSLSIRGNNVSISKLVEFLSPNEYEEVSEVTGLEEQHLKFLNISNNPQINKWTIQDPTLFTCSSSLMAYEISFDAWQQIEKSNPNHEIIAMKYHTDFNSRSSMLRDSQKAEPVKWQCYIDSSYGRRYWIYKTDKYLNRADLFQMSNMIKYDSDGHKIIEIVKQPDFLKFAQAKIMLGCGIVSQSNIRRNLSYRDFKPPISQFLTRNGGITFGDTPQPIITPRLPPGGWRIIHDDSEDIEYESDARTITPQISNTLHSINEESTATIPSGNDDTIIVENEAEDDIDVDLRNGLYWDRSIQNLQSLSIQGPPQENDDEYLNNPELQRRRSQLSLLRSRSMTNSRSKLWPPPHNNSENNILGIMRPPLSNTSSTVSIMTKKLKRQQKLKTDYYYDHPEEYIYNRNDPVMTERYRIHFELVNEFKVFGNIERGMYRYYSLKT